MYYKKYLYQKFKMCFYHKISNNVIIYNAYNKINKADVYALFFPFSAIFFLNVQPILCSIYFDRKFKGNRGLGDTCGVKYFIVKKGRIIFFLLLMYYLINNTNYVTHCRLFATTCRTRKHNFR